MSDSISISELYRELRRREQMVLFYQGQVLKQMTAIEEITFLAEGRDGALRRPQLSPSDFAAANGGPPQGSPRLSLKAAFKEVLPLLPPEFSTQQIRQLVTEKYPATKLGGFQHDFKSLEYQHLIIRKSRDLYAVNGHEISQPPGGGAN